MSNATPPVSRVRVMRAIRGKMRLYRRALSRALSLLARVTVVGVIALVGLALNASGASAGRYHVYSCRMPDGKAAPTDGWIPSTSPASATVSATDTCTNGGALIAALRDGIKHEVGSAATWTLHMPSPETFTTATLWRSGDTEGGAAQNATYQFLFAGPTMYEGFGECLYVMSCKTEGEPAEPTSLANILAVPSRNVGSNLYMTTSCGGLSGYSCPEGTKDPAGYAAVVYLYAADLLLEQTAQPTISPGSVGGELATSSKLSGTASVTFEASDSGSGIYRAVVEADGKAVGTTALDSNGGRCVDVGQTTDGLPAFLYLKPCSPTVSADVPLDTTSLPNGVHHLVVSVTDAAGNSAVVLDRNVEVANAARESSSSSSSSSSSLLPGGGSGLASGIVSSGGTPPGVGSLNGSPASTLAVLAAHWRSTPRDTAVGRWGRSQTIVGRLTSVNGTPISGASLEVDATPSSEGARESSIGGVRAQSDGTFSVRLSPHSSSERVAISYRAHIGDPLPVAVRTLSLRVAASLSLSISPRLAHLGGTIVFSGRLRGGHIPPGGKQIVLQARSAGTGWRTFQALSTTRTGRYRASYRFRLAGPVTYRFRAVSRQEADFPFASGGSNVVSVFER